MPLTETQKKETVQRGYYFTKGVIIRLAEFLGLGIIIVVFMYLVLGFFEIGTDDSDASSWKRSGFRIMKDEKTGIEYLSDGKGGLIKRG